MRDCTNGNCWTSRPTSQSACETARPTTMIKSMTGFASLTHEDEGATIGVVIKTVNRRFLGVQLRVPPSLAALDSRVRTLL